jgi:hypothetical protein
VKPRNIADLAQLADQARASRDSVYLTDVEQCDVCSTSLLDHRWLVDGAVLAEDGDQGWAMMCASCFMAHGKGIRWGSGQLYERASDNSWLLVAGFPPE